MDVGSAVAEFLAMGGYGAYVWSAYGLALLVLILNAVLAYRTFYKIYHRLQRRLR